jgi:hypothetical protein
MCGFATVDNSIPKSEIGLHCCAMRTLVFAMLLLVSSVHAQYMQAIPPKAEGNCEARADKMENWLKDWPNLGRYHESDMDLAAKLVAGRVVFMGDSITDHWDIGASFPGKPYVNRGISGQTTCIRRRW